MADPITALPIMSLQKTLAGAWIMLAISFIITLIALYWQWKQAKVKNQMAELLIIARAILIEIKNKKK